MTTLKQIEKEKQLLARTEKSLAFEKLKQRRTDTRRKIEFGGLVIKAKMDSYSKVVILGALDYAFQRINQDEKYKHFFAARGSCLFETQG